MSSDPKKKRTTETVLHGAGLNLSHSKARKIAAVLEAGNAEGHGTDRSTCVSRVQAQLGADCFSAIQLPGAQAGRAGPVLHVVSLRKQLQAKCAADCSFESLLLSAVQATASRGLTAILYFDDVVPGNIIRPDNARKSTLAYLSIAELQGAISKASGWLQLCVIRKDEVQQAEGGTSTVLAHLLRHVIDDLLQVFPLETSSGSVRAVRFSRLFLLADEDALRAGLAVKGASGLRPRFQCQNCVSIEHRELHDFYSIAHSDFRDFLPQTSANVQQIMDSLRSLTAQPVKLREAQTLLGWYVAENSVICQPRLSAWLPVEHCLFDPLHCYYSCGIVNEEIGLFLAACKRAVNLTQGELLQLARAGWQRAGSRHTAPEIFSPKLLKLDGTDFRGNATQCKLALPLLAYLAKEMLGRAVPAETRSLLLLHRCAQILQQLKTSPTEALLLQLESSQREHLAAFQAVFGAAAVRPKHHYALHIPRQVRKVGRLLDTLAVERKHRLFKLDVAPRAARLDRFSRDCLAMLLELELKEVLQKSSDAVLLGPTLSRDLCLAWPGKVVHEASKIQLRGVGLQTGFVLDCRQQAFQVLRFLRVDDEEHLAELLEMTKVLANPHWSRWKFPRQKPLYVKAVELLHFHHDSWSLPEAQGVLMLH